MSAPSETATTVAIHAEPVAGARAAGRFPDGRARASAEVGERMHAFIRDLYPICRSITGDGVRETLRRIGERIPLEMREVPTGTPVFDWTVPREWNIRDAYVARSDGERVIDFRRSNLHVVGYSMPIRTHMSLSELRGHLHSLPDRPDWIPYRTAYYADTWGFCLAHRQLEALAEDTYEVCIDSSLEPGFLTYGECRIQGRTEDEVLVSCHVCHPSMCNDNLSGIALATALAERLAGEARQHTYRVVFLPATIGAITWLARNEEVTRRIRHGLVLACVGDPGAPTYKQSRRGDALIDRAASHVLGHRPGPYRVVSFSPYGYDERQYGSPGLDLPVGRFTRTPHGEFAEYHTSADDLDFVRPEALADSFTTIMRVFDVVDGDAYYRNRLPKCEPQLGRRGLYESLGGGSSGEEGRMALLWVLNGSDGTQSLLDIAERSGIRHEVLRQAADTLVAHDLIERMEVPRS